MSVGITRTERYLASLARRSFLSLWSHPNCFRVPSKELCDVLVACHNVVIVFSDKEVRFDSELPLPQAWARWYNRAILKSVKQLRRAGKWVRDHPDRIFKDAQCTERLPLFERVDRPLEIHLVAVANGAARPCIKHFSGGSGSLLISPDEPQNSPEPFCVGKLGGPDLFVHVFDEAHLHVVLQELDTVRDFSDYLKARERLILNDNLFSAAGEEDLLAVYLKDINETGAHDFVVQTGKRLEPNEKIIVPEGIYDEYRKADAYRRKKLADRQSYLWDRLIDKFAHHLLAGTLAAPPEGFGEDGRNGGAELGLRFMALEPRVQRRAHATAILTAFDFLEQSKGNRFFRAMIPETPEQGDTGFCILLMNRDIAPPGTPFEEYRQFRAMNLGAYTFNLLEKNRHLNRVIGIATNGLRAEATSEDLVYHEPPEWTDDAIASAREQAEAFEIFTGAMSRTPYATQEYPENDTGLKGEFSQIPYRLIQRPDVSRPPPSGNRRERRAATAKQRKHPAHRPDRG